MNSKELDALRIRIITSWMIFQVVLPFIVLTLFTCVFVCIGMDNVPFNILGKGDLLFSWGILMLALSLDLNAKMENSKEGYRDFLMGFVGGFLFVMVGVLLKFVAILLENGTIENNRDRTTLFLTIIGVVGWIIGMVITTGIKRTSVDLFIENLKP